MIKKIPGMMLCVMFLFSCKGIERKLPEYGDVPAWAFMNQDAQPFGSAQLLGRAWAANFIFTSCPTACPTIAKKTHTVQEKMREWLPQIKENRPVLVSISVDPLTDTPTKLREFGSKHYADYKIWQLVTGDYDAMENLVTKGFLQALDRSGGKGEKTLKKVLNREPTPLDTVHSMHFVLIDKVGKIRGFYGQDANALTRLAADLRYLSEKI